MKRIRNFTLVVLALAVVLALPGCGPEATPQPKATLASAAAPVPTFSAAQAVAIAAGDYHTCAITSAGTVKCWGSNSRGQLGDGTTVDRDAPVDVQGLADVVAIDVGDEYTCAVTRDGNAYCWGENRSGQLGDGSKVERHAPVQVQGIKQVTQISASPYHACAVTKDGGAMCWGAGSYGSLGDGKSSGQTKPVKVAGLDGRVKAIAAGGFHSCAVTIDGEVKCWGSNEFGQLGDGNGGGEGNYSAKPVDVRGLADVVTLGAGTFHTCALTITGGVRCWGQNRGGQVGDGGLHTDRFVPSTPRGLGAGVSAISVGSISSCALTLAGGVKCWPGNILDDEDIPTDIEGLSGVTALAVGTQHTCVVTTGGAVKCWGLNQNGQLGIGSSTPLYMDVAEPIVVPDIADAFALTTGTSFTCAGIETGGVKCWGSNHAGQLGDGTRETRDEIVNVIDLSERVTALSSGSGHTCALTTAGGVKCWGWNMDGQLGFESGDYAPTPQYAQGLETGVVGIFSGFNHTCAVMNTGESKCWGSNRHGQLGDGTPASFDSDFLPSKVQELTDRVTTMAAGVEHTCALYTGGAVVCWGLGYGPSPVEVEGLEHVTTLSAGNEKTCALLGDGSVKCWSNAGHPSALAVDGLDPARILTLGFDTSDPDTACTVGKDGSVKCWGGAYGSPPKTIPGLAEVATVSTREGHTCALGEDRRVRCWGDNNSGEVTPRIEPWRTQPTNVVGFAHDSVTPASLPTLTVGTPPTLPTATPNATEQAILAQLAAAKQWPPVLTDWTDDNPHSWQTGARAFGTVSLNRSIKGDKYLWEIKKGEGGTPNAVPDMAPVADFYASVDARRLSGPGNTEFILVFRSGSDSAYGFQVLDEGRFVVYEYGSNMPKEIVYLTETKAIRPGEMNRLAVLAQGKRLLFFINDQFVGEAVSALTGGSIGLSVGLGDNEQAVVEYSNFVLRVPPSQVTPTPNSAQATATAQVQASALEAANHWQLVVADDFSTNKNEWPLIDSSERAKATAELSDGVYRWTLEPNEVAGKYEVAAKLPTLTDFYASVDAKMVSGPGGYKYGMVMRVGDEGYYDFRIRNDRYSAVGRAGEDPTTLVRDTFTAALKPGEKNKLGVIARGNKLAFFINDQYVTEAVDDHITGGQIGIAYGVDEVAPAVFEFDNFEVRVPAATLSATPTRTSTPASSTQSSTPATRLVAAGLQNIKEASARFEIKYYVTSGFDNETLSMSLDGEKTEIASHVTQKGHNIY